MFSFLKKVLTTVIPWSSDFQGNDLDEEEQIIVDRIKNLQTIYNENYAEVPKNITDGGGILLRQSDLVHVNVENYKCIFKTGKVTHLCNDCGVIDEVVYFEPNQVSAGLVLKVDDEVLYSAYRAKENEAERVYKVYALKNDSWDQGNDILESGITALKLQEPEEIPAINRIITGRVTQRRGREVYVESADIWCNLDKIQTSYIPVEGDWVELSAAVSLNEETVDLAGDILEVKSLKPLLMKSGIGRISLWSYVKKEGAIENFIYFTSASCEEGYVPSLGDEVAYDAVESDQERFRWRALRVLVCKTETEDKRDRSLNMSQEFPTMDTNASPKENGITIVPSVCSVEITLNESKIVTFELVNNGSVEQFLEKANFLSSENSQMMLLSPKDGNSTFIHPKQSILYQFQCEGKNLGLSEEVFYFYFKDFVVTKCFEINVLSSREMNKFLECKIDTAFELYERKNLAKGETVAEVVTYGAKPWEPPKFVMRERRCIFKIPKTLWNMGTSGKLNEKTLLTYAPYLKSDLNFRQYAERFHTLLYLEEIELKFNFRKFDLKGVYLEQRDDGFCLEVPGLVERRPSLIVGDRIVVRQPWLNNGKTEHIGYIHNIREKEIYVQFHISFHNTYDGSDCDVIFEPNTNFFSRCHEAVNRGVKVLGRRWLFPTSVNEKLPQVTFDVEQQESLPEKVAEGCEKVPKGKSRKKKPIPLSSDVSNIESSLKDETCASSMGKSKKKLVWVNTSLNDRQKLAVKNILEGRGRPLPYIIFGPPGTGKTVTLVEVVIQIYQMIPESRILITTPSNSAADLVCERLIELGNFKPGQLVRLVAIYRVFEGLVPAKLVPYSTFFKPRSGSRSEKYDKSNVKGSSLTELVGMHRITVATCVTIGSLHFSGVRPGHFSHILVDEAGQTSEPEVLITTSFQDVENGQVVLAGDPQQLGPVICSNLAKKMGLGTSLMQRLISTFPYCKDVDGFPNSSGYDPRFITKLTINYRCVPEILLLPSQLFYNSDLIPTVSQTKGEEANIIKKFNLKIGERKTPPAIIFHGTIGQNYQDKDSPSWYNPHEVWQIVFYIKKLYSIKLDREKIGIVAPYLKQVQKLRHLLSALELPIPKIGTVEEFQGQERHVILVTTVRSCPRKVVSDVAHSLGFVASPQRLNVALTRARALLIIVGNPILLSQDPYWVNVLKYCIKNNSYTGCALDSIRKKLDVVTQTEGNAGKLKDAKDLGAPN